MMFQLFNPLEQFQLVPFITLRTGVFDFSLTNSTFFIIWSLVVFLLLVYLCTFVGKGSIVPNRWQSFLENLYHLVLGVVLDNLNLIDCWDWTVFSDLEILQMIVSRAYRPTISQLSSWYQHYKCNIADLFQFQHVDCHMMKVLSVL
jgi:hypothetical protein